MFRPSRRLARAATCVVVPLLVTVAGCSGEHSEASPAFGSVVSVEANVAAVPLTSDGYERVAIDHVAMVGDSITVGSHDELIAAFTELGLPDTVINAESGRRMTQSGSISSGLDGIADVLAAGPSPDLWVIALGSNDVASYSADETAAAINEVLAALPPDVPVVWVDTYLENYQDDSATFDDVLRQVLGARGNATVVDWASIAPEDGVLADNVHPSGFGRAEFARRVRAAVSDWMA